MQRRTGIAPQDANLDAIGSRRNASHPLCRVLDVKHVRQVRIAVPRHGGEDSVVAVLDHIQQPLFVRHLSWDLASGGAVSA